jgi:hypothetical protein
MLYDNKVFMTWLIYFNFMHIICSFVHTVMSNLMNREKKSYYCITKHMENFSVP